MRSLYQTEFSALGGAGSAEFWRSKLAAVVVTVAAGTVASASAIAIAAVVIIAASCGHGWDGRGQVGAALGIDNEVALLAFAEGVGFDVFHVLEGEMKHAALAGVGGREAIGHTGSADALGGGFGGELDLLGAQSFEVEGIEADQIVFADVEAKNLDGDVLEGAKKFAAALGEHGSVGAGELDVEDLCSLGFGGLGSCAGADAIFEAQAAEADDGVEEICDLAGGLL